MTIGPIACGPCDACIHPATGDGLQSPAVTVRYTASRTGLQVLARSLIGCLTQLHYRGAGAMLRQGLSWAGGEQRGETGANGTQLGKNR